MGMTIELDLSGFKTEDEIESAGRLSPGWYRAQVHDHYENSQKPGQCVLVFQIQEGDHAGFKSDYRFEDPSYETDPAKQKRAMQRVMMLASRLGLINKQQVGKAGVSIDFDAAIGKDMVIQVTSRNSKDQFGNPVIYVNIAYEGVFPPDHPKIPADVRTALGLPPARAGAADAAPAAGNAVRNGAAAAARPAARVADDFSDL